MEIEDLSTDVKVYLEHKSTNVSEDLEYIKRVENFKNKVAVLDSHNIYKLKIITFYNRLSTSIDITNCFCEDIKIPKYINNIYVYLPVTLKLSSTRRRIESIGRLVLDNAEQLHIVFKYNSMDILPLLRYNKLYINDLKSFNRWMVELLDDLIKEANNSKIKEFADYTLAYIIEVKNQLKLRNDLKLIDKTESIHEFLNIEDNIEYDKSRKLLNRALEDLKNIML